MSQSWQQDVVDAQAEVNRCNFKANQNRMNPDLEYVVRHAQHAVADLQNAVDKILKIRGNHVPWSKR